MSEKIPCLLLESGKNSSINYNDVALCCVNITTNVLNMIASGAVVYRYYQTRARQPVSNTLLVFLASLDLFKSTLTQPLYISIFILKFFGIFSCTYQRVTEAVMCISLGFGFVMATYVLTSERFFAIVYPIRHRVYMRKKVLLYACLTLFGVWVIFFTTFHIIYTTMIQLYRIYLVVLSLGLAYTLAVYLKIFFVTRESRSWLDEKARDNSLHNNTNSQRAGTITGPGITPCQKALGRTHEVFKFNFTAKEKKIIFRMLSIIGVLYLTCAPLLATFVYVVVKGMDVLALEYFYPWSTTVFFTSGVINAYVYCYRNEHFRMRKPPFNHVVVSSARGTVSGHQRSRQISTI